MAKKDEDAITVSMGKAASETGTPEEFVVAEYPEATDGKPHPDRWKHEAAASLHGWAEHAHHSGASFRLTLKQYKDAIAAATTPTGSTPMYQPAAEACSEHAPFMKLKKG